MAMEGGAYGYHFLHKLAACYFIEQMVFMNKTIVWIVLQQ